MKKYFTWTRSPNTFAISCLQLARNATFHHNMLAQIPDNVDSIPVIRFIEPVWASVWGNRIEITRIILGERKKKSYVQCAISWDQICLFFLLIVHLAENFSPVDNDNIRIPRNESFAMNSISIYLFLQVYCIELDLIVINGPTIEKNTCILPLRWNPTMAEQKSHSKRYFPSAR